MVQCHTNDIPRMERVQRQSPQLTKTQCHPVLGHCCVSCRDAAAEHGTADLNHMFYPPRIYASDSLAVCFFQPIFEMETFSLNTFVLLNSSYLRP